MSKSVKCHEAITGAPSAVGPYSVATENAAGAGYVFLSGQIGLNPSTGQLATGGIEGQTAQVMVNIKAVLAGLGLEFTDVIKTTIFLTDLAHFATVNKMYGDAMNGHKPARSTIQVAGLPLGAIVEIEMIAVRK